MISIKHTHVNCKRDYRSISPRLFTLHSKTRTMHLTTVRGSLQGNVEIVSIDKIYKPFFEDYIKICDIPTFITNIKPHECMKTLFFPDTEQQIEIVNTVAELENMVPIKEIKPYLMYFMTQDDMDSANVLLKTYETYLHSMHSLKEMIITIFM